MTPASPTPNDALHREILEDGRREEARRLEVARREADELLRQAEREVSDVLEANRARAVLEAERRCAVIRATLPTAIQRLRALRMEAWLDSIRTDAMQHLLERDRLPRRKCLLTLTREAIERMAGESFVIRLSRDDQPSVDEAFLDGLGQSIGSRAIVIRATFDPLMAPGGVVVESEDGRERWNNTLVARMARNWPELRGRLAAAAGLCEDDLESNSAPGGIEREPSEGGAT
jgi:vacuolar-type H+-ATPase subunit E/Vma4